MGGAIFLRTGTLTITNNSQFNGNAAVRGGIDSKGYGGAIFAMTQAAIDSQKKINPQGLPSTLPTIKMGSTTIFTGNTATNSATKTQNALGTNINTDPVFGTTATTAAGKALDGPIAGATVFFDSNLNGVQDADEPFTTTDSAGNYHLDISNEFDTNGNNTLDINEGQYVLVGGTDVITGQAFTSTLKATVGSTVVTPLTNLLTQLVATGLTTEQAETQLETALGLPASVDLTTFDPLDAAQTGSADGLKILGAQVAIQTLVTQLSQSIQTVATGVSTNTASNAVINAITNAIQDGNPIDLTNSNQIQSLVNSAVDTLAQTDNTLDLSNITDNSTALAQVIAGSNQQILSATDSSKVFQAQTVAQGSTTTDLQAALNGTQTFNDVVTNNTGNNLTNKVAAATINVLPVAVGDTITTDENTTFNGNLLTNDSSIGGGSLTVSAVNSVVTDVGQSITLESGATLTVNSDGTFSYNPNPKFDSLKVGETATDIFTYSLTSGTSTDLATVNLTINGVNDAPVANNDNFFNTNEDAPISIDLNYLLANDTDAEGDSLSLNNFTQPLHGSLTLDNGNLIYTPVADYNGTDGFTYIVNDGTVDSSSATVNLTIDPVNDVPTLTGTPATLSNGTEDIPYTINVTNLLQGFSDVESDSLSVSNLSATNGSLTTNNNGSYTFNPTANYNGVVTLNYEVIDGKGGITPVTNSFNLAAVNDAPIVANLIADANATENSAFSYTFAANSFSDPNHDTLSYIAKKSDGNALPSWLKFDANNRTFTGTPANNDVGTLSVQVTASDGTLSTSDIFNIAVAKIKTGVSINLTTGVSSIGDAEGDILTYVQNQRGSDYNDTLIGNSNTNYLYSFAGDDLLDGGSGIDYLYAGVGNDTLLGGIGNDNLYGEVGNDTLTGDDGNDLLTGGSGADVLDGGQGIDTVIYTTSVAGVAINLANATASSGDAEGDSISNVENVQGSNLNDTITGNDSTNYLYSFAGDDLLDGGSGIDYLYAGVGNDTLLGGIGNDNLYGEAGNDSLTGDDGNDLLTGGSGADVLDGGQGIDTVIYTTSVAGVAINLANATASSGDAEGDSISNVENVQGSNLNDTITGNDSTNYLYSFAGDDLLDGGSGIDYLYAGVGNDTLLGGIGNDNLYGEVGNDSLTGDDGNDLLTGGSGADVLDGGQGIDTVIYTTSVAGVAINLANATASSGDAEGDSISNVENVQGSNLNDTITGNNSSNSLYGYAGNDSLVGGSGIDYLYAGIGNDTLLGDTDNDDLYGEVGDDIIYGGTGNDALTGGDGRDTLTGANLASFGVGEIDYLTGNSGADTFVLGTTNQVYYNDSVNTNAGVKDYAKIIDWKVNEDVVQLTNNLSYYLGAAPIGTYNANGTGTGIFIDNDGTAGLSAFDELIGVLQGVSLTAGAIAASTPGFTMV